MKQFLKNKILTYGNLTSGPVLILFLLLLKIIYFGRLGMWDYIEEQVFSTFATILCIVTLKMVIDCIFERTK